MIIATAGHVDHGKTSLVRNLTGVETDRLEEEKRRGLSINLGYAYWKISPQVTLGFIDVPGHRRFINTMISGVSSIDLGMLVVAADDGVMPQTREHLQVMNLLGVTDYLLVVSKCDRVEEARVTEVRDNALALLPASTRSFKLSNITGTGIDELKTELKTRAEQWTASASNGRFRMSIDRAFNLKGQGLVLTGSATSGSVSTGDSVLLQPQNKPLRIRSIRAQDADTDIARAGQRCALNIAGASSQSIHKDDIDRGDWLVTDSTVPVTNRVDARVFLLSAAPFSLKRVSNVKLHIGAKRASARLVVLGANNSKLRAGESAIAQLIIDRAIACCHGDRFIVRDTGETATLGGGVVIDPFGAKHRKSNDSRLRFLAAMENSNHDDAIQAALQSEDCVLDYGAFLRARNIPLDTQQEKRPGMHLPNVWRITMDEGEFWLHQDRWQKIKNSINSTLQELHKKFSNEPGIKPALVRNESLSAPDKRFFQAATIELVKDGHILMQDGVLKAKGHTVAVKSSPAWQTISQCLTKHGLTIPSVSQLREQCGLESKKLEQALQLATRNKQLLKLNTKRYALPATVQLFAQAVLELNAEGTELTVIQFRDRMACGRNLAVEVLEYFDSVRFTQRRGESRIILDTSLPAALFTPQ